MKLDYWKWLDIGVENGWISKPTCATHDWLDMTDEESNEWDEGFDPCIPAVRLWGHERVTSDIELEENHPVM